MLVLVFKGSAVCFSGRRKGTQQGILAASCSAQGLEPGGKAIQVQTTGLRFPGLGSG